MNIALLNSRKYNKFAIINNTPLRKGEKNNEQD
jgi:hypothetical protein